MAAVLGKDDADIRYDQLEQPLHRRAVAAVVQLKQAAAAAGFSLDLASGYRSFDRQLLLWNAKARGERPVLDSAGSAIDMTELSEAEQLFAILRWSALPGASRHHWGSDFDVYDSCALAGDPLQLSVAETEPGGVFASFYCWLDEYLEHDSRGFFRPYDCDRGGVAREPWHLSYGPLAREFERAQTIDALTATLADADIALRQAILANIEQIYVEYVVNTAPAPACGE